MIRRQRLRWVRFAAGVLLCLSIVTAAAIVLIPECDDVCIAPTEAQP